VHCALLQVKLVCGANISNVCSPGQASNKLPKSNGPTSPANGQPDNSGGAKAHRTLAHAHSVGLLSSALLADSLRPAVNTDESMGIDSGHAYPISPFSAGSSNATAAARRKSAFQPQRSPGGARHSVILPAGGLTGNSGPDGCGTGKLLSMVSNPSSGNGAMDSVITPGPVMAYRVGVPALQLPTSPAHRLQGAFAAGNGTNSGISARQTFGAGASPMHSQDDTQLRLHGDQEDAILPGSKSVPTSSKPVSLPSRSSIFFGSNGAPTVGLPLSSRLGAQGTKGGVGDVAKLTAGLQGSAMSLRLSNQRANDKIESPLNANKGATTINTAQFGSKHALPSYRSAGSNGNSNVRTAAAPQDSTICDPANRRAWTQSQLAGLGRRSSVVDQTDELLRRLAAVDNSTVGKAH